jgi:hypothetical protein
MTVKTTAKKQFLSASNIAALTGLSVPRIDQLIGLGTVLLSHADKQAAEGSGNHRRVSLPTVYQFGITAALIKLGIPSKPSANAAKLYAMDQPGRIANCNFEFGRTLLLVKSIGAEIVNADSNSTIAGVFGRQIDGATILDLGRITTTIDEAIISTKGKDTK